EAGHAYPLIDRKMTSTFSPTRHPVPTPVSTPVFVCVSVTRRAAVCRFFSCVSSRCSVTTMLVSAVTVVTLPVMRNSGPLRMGVSFSDAESQRGLAVARREHAARGAALVDQLNLVDRRRARLLHGQAVDAAPVREREQHVLPGLQLDDLLGQRRAAQLGPGGGGRGGLHRR